jgi:NitT/TauT family transport system substrate-binding protein
MLVHAQQATPKFVRFCLYTTGKALATKREAAVRFVAAEMRGLDYALKNKDAMVALSREITKAAADDLKPAYIYDEVIRYKSVTPDFGIPFDKLMYMRDLLAEVGFLDKPLDLKAMIDVSVRDDAARLSTAQRD